jgi:hypothetical protein
MDQMSTALKDIVLPVLASALTALLLGITHAAWTWIKGQIAASKYAKQWAIVEPIIASVINDSRFQVVVAKVTDPKSPSGVMPTEAEIREVAAVVLEIAKPQLHRVTGFAVEHAETEVVAMVRRFFAYGRGRWGFSLPADSEVEKPEIVGGVLIDPNLPADGGGK